MTWVECQVNESGTKRCYDMCVHTQVILVLFCVAVFTFLQCWLHLLVQMCEKHEVALFQTRVPHLDVNVGAVHVYKQLNKHKTYSDSTQASM
jgi:hypothetical protein